jgi:CubicO group peptidase (beta-lactamase class C family)
MMPARTAAALVVLLAIVRSYVRGDELPTAKPADVGLDAKKLAEVDAAVTKLVEQEQIAGAVVAVLRKGRVAHLAAFGQSDRERKLPMRTDTIFRIYSMSKPITSVAAMMLVEEGKLELDAPVSKYLPDLAGVKVYVVGEDGSGRQVDADREMTVRDLMRHTSGLTYGIMERSPVDSVYLLRNVLSRDIDLKTMVKRLGSMPLKHQPGTQFEYSVSTDVLGRVVEVVSERPLDEFFAERIFRPLDMRDTGFFVPADKAGRLAANYTRGDDGKLALREDPQSSQFLENPKMLSGGGGLVSTIRDYSRFCQMLVGQGTLGGARLLKAETVQMMTRNQLPDSAYPIKLGLPRPGVGFGLGFGVRVQADENEPGSVVSEYRWGGAASTHFWIVPQQELAVVVMQQQMPFTPLLERAVKPLVAESIRE